MYGLDLFSGIGGLSVALRPWVRTVAYCEVDRYCQGVLLSRMQSGELSEAPIWDDVRTLKRSMLPKIDIIFGGFPCQDISVAGAGKGLDGERSGLFLHIVRLAQEIRPSFIFLENVPAIRTRGLGVVLRELSEIGYDARWTIVSAEEVGAPHRRERWFLLAHPTRKPKRLSITEGRSTPVNVGRDGSAKFVADTVRAGLEGWPEPEKAWTTLRELGCEGAFAGIQGLPEPAIRRSVDGISNRVERVKSLGNGVVPQQAREAFQRLAGIGVRE